MPKIGPEYYGAVSLLFMSESSDPSEITKLLGTAPTESWRKGDHPTGSFKRKQSTWRLKNPKEDTYRQLESEIIYWLDFLRDRQEPLTQARLLGWSCILDCFISAPSTITLNFTADKLRLLAEIGADLSINCFRTTPERFERGLRQSKRSRQVGGNSD